MNKNTHRLIVFLRLSDKEKFEDGIRSYGVSIFQLAEHDNDTDECISVRGQHLYENESYIDHIVLHNDPLKIVYGPSEFAAFHNAKLFCEKAGWHVVNPPESEKLHLGYYLFITLDDIEPQIKGPFKTEVERNTFARNFREEKGPDHGIFALDVNKDGKPETYAYSGGFFEEE